MKAMKMVLVLLMVAAQLFAQERTDATGGEANGLGGTVSYSVGLIDYEALVGSNGILTEGMQQPYEIFAVGVEHNSSGSSIAVYPNPVRDFLVLDVGGLPLETIRYELIDQHGKLLICQQVTNSKTEISLPTLARACYFLRVLQVEKEIQTFKVIKN